MSIFSVQGLLRGMRNYREISCGVANMTYRGLFDKLGEGLFPPQLCDLGVQKLGVFKKVLMDFRDRSWRVIIYRGCEDNNKGRDGVDVDLQKHATST